MNWLRCSSADSGNSRSFTVTPLLSLLKSAIVCLRSPDVSLPEQYVTVPFALSIDAGSTAFEPLVEPVFSEPEVELPPPPPLSLPPHAANTSEQTKTTMASQPLRVFILSPSSILRSLQAPRPSHLVVQLSSAAYPPSRGLRRTRAPHGADGPFSASPAISD